MAGHSRSSDVAAHRPESSPKGDKPPSSGVRGPKCAHRAARSCIVGLPFDQGETVPLTKTDLIAAVAAHTGSTSKDVAHRARWARGRHHRQRGEGREGRHHRLPDLRPGPARRSHGVAIPRRGETIKIKASKSPKVSARCLVQEGRERPGPGPQDHQGQVVPTVGAVRGSSPGRPVVASGSVRVGPVIVCVAARGPAAPTPRVRAVRWPCGSGVPPARGDGCAVPAPGTRAPARASARPVSRRTA